MDSSKIKNNEYQKHSSKKSKKYKKKAKKNSAESNETNTNTNNPETEVQKNQVLKRWQKRKLEEEQLDAENGGSEPKKSKQSRRQHKREYHETQVAKEKEESDKTQIKKALSYLSLWKHNKAEWKFQKLQQIWIQSNMFDENKIPNANWPTVNEYFSESKGKVRDILIASAQKILESKEEWNRKSEEAEQNNEEFKEPEPSATSIERARDILQSL